jgi:hypothetical protein
MALCGLALLALASCGKGTVDITGAVYVPKIVIDATLMPGKPVNDVLITRNVPLDAAVDVSDLLLASAQATITDTAGNVYPLTFDPVDYAFENWSLHVQHGATYRLDVSATIDGHALSAWAVTTVPDPGFNVIRFKSRLDTLSYRQRDSEGNLLNFNVAFQRTPGNEFYALSVTALDADTSTFIYDNAFYDFDASDVVEYMDELAYGFNWIQNAPPEAGESNMEVFWFHLNFYGDYRGVVYAGDKNFRDYFVTQENVQEIDGNFHEPTLHVEGDGIGVFGSALADTVYFTVIR